MCGIEKQMFDCEDCEDWDDVGTLDLVFYGVTLKKDIGTHKKGDKFLVASMLLSESKLELQTEGGETYEYKLVLSVV